MLALLLRLLLVAKITRMACPLLKLKHCLVSKVTTGKMPFTVKQLANTASPCPYLARIHYALIY